MMLDKNEYEKPMIEVLDFNSEDIVTASLNRSIPPDTESYEGDIIKSAYKDP